MIKHGASHGLSVLFCTVIAAVLVEILRPHIPKLYSKVNHFSEKLVDFFHIHIKVENFSILLVASVPGILWGIFFKMRFAKGR